MELKLPHSTKRDPQPVTRWTRGQFDIIRDSLSITFLYRQFLPYLSRSQGRHPIRHVIEEHAPDDEEELSRDGDGRPLPSPEVLQLEVLQPHPGILRDEYPGALHEVGSHPLVAAPGDPPLARPFPCRILGGGEPNEGGELVGAFEPRHVL